MIKKVRASVAMATYNGERYISEQIESIIDLMSDNDELVISDDGSTDGTIDIIKRYISKDDRITFVKNSGSHGVCGNFSNAVSLCSGKYIFLSDQDDIWVNDKINKMVKISEKESADLVICDGSIANENLEKSDKTFLKSARVTTSPLRNYFKGRFWGCCMCFKYESFEYLLPFPDNSPHDIFSTIMVGLKRGKIVIYNEELVVHRVHGNNVTPQVRNNMRKIILNRWFLLINIAKRTLGSNLLKCQSGK